MTLIDEAARSRCIKTLDRDLSTAQRMKRFLGYKRPHLLELMDVVGEVQEATSLFENALKEWESVEAYTTRYLEALFHRDDAILDQWDGFMYCRMLATAVSRTNALTGFIQEKMKAFPKSE